jgi:hypothetical protein
MLGLIAVSWTHSGKVIALSCGTISIIFCQLEVLIYKRLLPWCLHWVCNYYMAALHLFEQISLYVVILYWRDMVCIYSWWRWWSWQAKVWPPRQTYCEGQEQLCGSFLKLLRFTWLQDSKVSNPNHAFHLVPPRRHTMNRGLLLLPHFFLGVKWHPWISNALWWMTAT